MKSPGGLCYELNCPFYPIPPKTLMLQSNPTSECEYIWRQVLTEEIKGK